MRELRRVAKFVLDTKNLGLCIVSTIYDGIWHLEALSDSDFANDKETRISVYGYIVFFSGYVAVSEVVKVIKFLYQLLISMGIMVH